MRIEVEQPSSTAEAHVVAPGEREPIEGGFGLRIVEELATKWGVRQGTPGAVWFEWIGTRRNRKCASVWTSPRPLRSGGSASADGDEHESQTLSGAGGWKGVLWLAGELDMAEADTFLEMAAANVDAQREVVLECSRLTFLDSRGYGPS